MPETTPFYRGAQYDPGVPTLEQVLGYDYGERVARPAEMERYFRVLAERADRASLVEYGRSVEGRPLLYLGIASPENIRRLEEIKANLRRLADPRECDREAAAGLVESTPAVTWVGANVHGGEHSSGEAALLLAYHLVAGEDERTEQI